MLGTCQQEQTINAIINQCCLPKYILSAIYNISAGTKHNKRICFKLTDSIKK